MRVTSGVDGMDWVNVFGEVTIGRAELVKLFECLIDLNGGVMGEF